MKRLFLLAAYTPSGKAETSLVFMARSLAEAGDVVLCADSTMEAESVGRLKPYLLHCMAERHGEYDFGSYRRAWMWAEENLDMAGYDFVYLVNDSVFGPIFGFSPLLERLERENRGGAFSLVYNPHRKSPHMQSWFVGLSEAVFREPWFDAFMKGIRKTSGKSEVCTLYETGLTELLTEHGVPIGHAFTARGKDVYNHPLRLCRKGLPFVKKSSFTRHNGSVGHEISVIVKEFPSEGTDAMIAGAREAFGERQADDIFRTSWIHSKLKYLTYLYDKIRR